MRYSYFGPNESLTYKKIWLVNSSLYGQSGLCSCLFFSGKFIEVNNYIQLFIFGCLINSPLNTFIGPVPTGYTMTPSKVCIHSSSFALRAILLIFLANTFCTSLLNLLNLSTVLLFSTYFWSPKIWFLIWWQTSLCPLPSSHHWRGNKHHREHQLWNSCMSYASKLQILSLIFHLIHLLSPWPFLFVFPYGQ